MVPGSSRIERWRQIGIDPKVFRNTGSNELDRSLRGRLPEYDVAYCGHLAEIRRVDLLIEAARLSPQLRVVIAGEGRTSTRIAREASALPNVNFVGWTDRPDEVLASARVVYYGVDPAWPYAAKACPNTLYQAIRLHW